MKLMQRLKKVKEDKKGFTLVELIAVIVILGILMAIMVPNFLNYMNKANEADDKVIARSLYIAANTLAAEQKYDVTKTKAAWKGTETGAGNFDAVIRLAGYAVGDVTGTGITLNIGFSSTGDIVVSYNTPNTKNGALIIPEGATIDASYGSGT